MVQWIGRKVSGKEVFQISDKGLENVYCNLSFMIFFVMPSAELIPWSAIKEFKIFTWTGGRKYVVAEVDEAKLLPQTPGMFRLQVRKSSVSTMKGLYFGSRNAKMPAEELIKTLKKYHRKYEK